MAHPMKPDHWTLSSLVGLVALIGTLGGMIGAAVAWTGGRILSPDARVSRIEQGLSAREVAVDRLFKEGEVRDHDLGDRVTTLTDLTLMLVSMQCLDPNPSVRAAAQQARVPCARVLRDQGISP